jgi:hypothetical protein
MNIKEIIKRLEVLNPTRKFTDVETVKLEHLYNEVLKQDNYLFVSYLHSITNLKGMLIAKNLTEVEKVDVEWSNKGMPSHIDVFGEFQELYN